MRYLTGSLILLFFGSGGRLALGVRGQTQSPQDPDTTGLPNCAAQCILQQSKLAKSTCVPDHANCYCSRTNFEEGVQDCVRSDPVLKCAAAGDVNITDAWVAGFCGDSRGGTGGGTGNGTVTLVSPTLSAPSSTSTSSSSTTSSSSSTTTSWTAVPLSNSTTPKPSPSPTPTPSSSLSTGAKAGIAIGIVALVAIIATLAFFFFRNQQQKKAKPPIYEVEDQKRVHEVDAATRPSEMDSKDSTLFSQPILAPGPVYELPSPGGGGESELDGVDTQRRTTPTNTNPVHNSSPLGREELVSRDGLPGS